jgi:hypothetical protein
MLAPMDCCHPGLMAEAPALDAMVYLTTGFLMSLGHCLGMCGPLVAAYAAAQGRGLWLAALPSQLIYHAGRLTTYAAFGLLLGLVGSATRMAGHASLQGGLSLFAGVLFVTNDSSGAGMMGASTDGVGIRGGSSNAVGLEGSSGAANGIEGWTEGAGNTVYSIAAVPDILQRLRDSVTELHRGVVGRPVLATAAFQAAPIPAIRVNLTRLSLMITGAGDNLECAGSTALSCGPPSLAASRLIKLRRRKAASSRRTPNRMRKSPTWALAHNPKKT